MFKSLEVEVQSSKKGFFNPKSSNLEAPEALENDLKFFKTFNNFLKLESSPSKVLKYD